MNTGIYVKLQQHNNLLFKHLFNGIDLSPYLIEISNAQVWKDELGSITFADNIYQDSAFQKIAFNPQYLIMQLNLKAFNNKITKIESYDDFKNSQCEFMLYIYDCNYIEVYCKSENFLSAFSDNIKSFLSFSEHEIITEDEIYSNNGRYKF